MPNRRPTIASVGLPRYIDAMAALSNSGKDWAWFDAQAAKIETGQITKKEVFQAMGITATTLDKYLTLRKIERVQQDEN